jgi:hypothetical protein
MAHSFGGSSMVKYLRSLPAVCSYSALNRRFFFFKSVHALLANELYRKMNVVNSEINVG